MDWDAIVVIVQAAELTVLIAALLFAWQQIREVRRQQLLDTLWRIFTDIDSEETRAARRYVYHNRDVYAALERGDAKVENLTPEQRNMAQKVSNTFDRFGYIAHLHLVSPRLLLEGYRVMVVRCWMVLEPFVRATRRDRDQGTYQEYFEALAKQAKQYVSRDEVRIGHA